MENEMYLPSRAMVFEKLSNKGFASSARFTGLSRRANRPAVLRPVAVETPIQPVSTGLFLGFSHLLGRWWTKAKQVRTLKRPAITLPDLTSRKTAGLFALRESPMNRAGEMHSTEFPR
jgi:hypothetical protein